MIKCRVKLYNEVGDYSPEAVIELDRIGLAEFADLNFFCRDYDTLLDLYRNVRQDFINAMSIYQPFPEDFELDFIYD